jgi:outer membrane protein TolC
MSCLGFAASLSLIGAVALTAHSQAVASEFPYRGASIENHLLQQGEELQSILSESEQLLNQSVRISLEDVIRKTIINNPQIAQSIALVQAKKSEVAAEKRKWNPTLKFSRTSENPILGKQMSTVIQSDDNYKNVEYANFTNANVAFVAARFKWNFLDPVRYSTINRSISLLQSQELLLSILCRSLVLEAQMVYAKLVENQNLINTYSSIYKKNRFELEAILGQFNGGIISFGDVAQQKTLLLNQLNELLALVALQIELASELAVLTGMPPGGSALPSQQQIHREEWSLSLEETIEEGLRLREEIQLALSDSKAADWQAQTMLNKYLPVLSLSVNGYGNYSDGLFGADIASSSSQDRGVVQATDLSIGLGLTWTPFDGGSYLASSNAFKDQAKADLLAANFQRDRVGRQIRGSYGEYLTTKAALAKAEQGLKIASLSVDIASERYSAGIGSVTTVVQATEMYGRAALILSETRVSYFDSIAKLYRYSGQWPSAYKQAIIDGLSSLKVSSRDMAAVF